MTHRTAARVVGILFVMATVPFSASVIILEPVLGSPDLLDQVSRSQGRIGLGILLELVNHIAVVGIAVVIYPVLKLSSERLALGYVAARSIEAALFAIGTFHLITDRTRCKGFDEEASRRIGDWLVEQGIVLYDQMNTLFSSITLPLQSQKLDIDNPQIAKMIFMALYNIDKFRDFVFESTFLDRFDVESVRIEKIKRSYEELLKFAFDWIKFGILGQKLFWIKEKPSV